MRSCYSTKMQLHADPTKPKTLITWYFCPPGAKVLGTPTAFGSSNYDYAPYIVPYLLGEQRKGHRTYYNGDNAWGYTGQCRIGSADQFANGLTNEDIALPPAPIPACCRPPAQMVWYLRPDLAPVPKVLPADWIQSWFFEPPTRITKALSPMMGSSPFSQASMPNPVSLNPTDALALSQFVSSPLMPQSVPNVSWVLGTAFSPVMVGGGTIRYWASLSLLNSAGQFKQWLRQYFAIGAADTQTLPLHTKLTVFNPGAVQFDLGDYLCLEIGIGHVSFSTPQNPLYAYMVNSGTTPFDASDIFIASPAGFLQIGP